MKMIVGQSPEHAYLKRGGGKMIKTSERNRCARVRFCGRKNCGFAGIDFILPADEDEWLCAPGTKGPAEPSTPRGSPGACTHLHTSTRLGEPRRCPGRASEGADIPCKGVSCSPRGVPFHLFLLRIAASSSSDGGSTAIKGTWVGRDHLSPQPRISGVPE